jgi:hypothetical protein
VRAAKNDGPALGMVRDADVDAEAADAAFFVDGRDSRARAARRSSSRRFLLAQKLSIAASCSPLLMMASYSSVVMPIRGSTLGRPATRSRWRSKVEGVRGAHILVNPGSHKEAANQRTYPQLESLRASGRASVVVGSRR